MPRTFNRIISFHVQGEIYDQSTKPESIIKNYNWSFEDNQDGNIQIFGHHKDNRGRITKMIKIPRIERMKVPDTDYYIKM